MPDFSSFLTQGSVPPSTTSSTSTQNSFPSWYNSYLSGIATNAANIAGSPYTSYNAPRIAPQDAQETQAYNYLGANANNWKGPLQQAQGAESGVAGGFDPNEFAKYESPHTSGVTDEIARLGNRNLTENLMPALNNEFIGNGQYASDRNRTMDERLVRDVGADISGQQAKSLEAGYGTAMQGYGQGQSNVNSAANNLGGLAQMDQGLTTGTAGALSASGATQRGYGQANYDLAYQDFQNQLNYPRQNISFLSSALNGSNIPTSQNQTTTAPYAGSMGPSPLSTFAGLALAGIGANKSTTPPAAAEGGYVPRFSRGGMLPAPTRRLPVRARARMAAPRGGLELMAA